MENWHEIIRCILFKENIDQKELALRLDCSRPYVSRIFTGKDEPSMRVRGLLIEMYNGDINQINENKPRVVAPSVVVVVPENKPKGATHYSASKERFFKYDADKDVWGVFIKQWRLFRTIKYVTDLQEI